MEDSLWQRGQTILTQGPRLFGVEGYGDERRRDGKLGTDHTILPCTVWPIHQQTTAPAFG